jgi:predicted SAM-dependent methyltransferase
LEQALVYLCDQEGHVLVKLNIGAGSVRRDGYLSVDVRPEVRPDIVSAAWDLKNVANNSIAEIYSRHMIEHLDPNDARRTLTRWAELLCPGGLLNVIAPDLEFHARQLLGTVISSFPNQEDHAIAGFYGWRDETRGGDREDAHRWGYTEESLARALSEAGFDRIARQLKGADSEPWHVNMIARRPDATTVGGV